VLIYTQKLRRQYWACKSKKFLPASRWKYPEGEFSVKIGGSTETESARWQRGSIYPNRTNETGTGGGVSD